MHIALSKYSPFPLLNVSRSPRRIKMMEGNQAPLHISPRAAFLSGPKQNAFASCIDRIVQFLLLRVSFGVVDVGNFLNRDAISKQHPFHFTLDLEPLLVRR